jgi:hypothetical protein
MAPSALEIASVAKVCRALSSYTRSTLAEIYLRHTCSCHEILRMDTPGQDSLVQGMKGFEGSWFSGCTRQFDVGPFFTVPPICGEEPLSPEADFWDTVNRVFYRAPLLAGQWQYPPGRSPQ